MNRASQEIEHFSNLKHIWPGQNTIAGQRRYENKARLFGKYCHPGKRSKILEIGCGDGEFTKTLKSIGASIIATDITPAVISRAKEKVCYPGLRYRIENCEKLSFGDNSFDIICGVSILHHVNAEKALKEAYRVLKKGGRLFFTEPNVLNPMLLLSYNIAWFRKKMEYTPQENPLYRGEITRKLKNTGFGKISVRNYDFLFPWTPHYLIPFFEKLGNILESLPFLRELSGSLVIYAVKSA